MNGKGIHITSKVMGGILAVLSIGVIMLGSKAVQRQIAKAIESNLESVITAKVSFTSLRVSTYGTVLLKDLVITDPTPYTADKYGKGVPPVDTIVFAKTVSATLSLKSLLKKDGIHVGRVNIEDGGLYIVTEPEEDTGRKTNFDAIAPSPQRDSDYVAQPGPNLFDIRRVNVRNFHFRLVNLSKEPTWKGECIDFEDMDLYANMRAHSLKMAGGKMYGVLDHCDAREKSGYSVKNITARAEVGLGKALLTDVHLVDELSDIRLRNFSMTFRNMYDFSDYVNKVVMEGDLGRSKVAMESVNWFSGGSLKGNLILVDVFEGHVKGTTNDLNATGLRFVDLYSGISATAGCRIRNVVPNVEDMILNGTVTGCTSDTRQMSSFLSEWSKVKGNPVDLSNLVKGKTLDIEAHCNGNINSLGFDAVISNPEIGRLYADGTVYDCLSNSDPISVKVHAVADGFDTGKAFGIAAVGAADAEGALGIVLNDTRDITLDSLSIRRLDAIGYEFNDVYLKGALIDSTLTASLRSSDPAAKTDIFALADLHPFDGRQRFRVAGDIDNLDFHALNFDKRGDVSSLSANIIANFVRDEDRLLGDAFIDGIKIVSDKGTHDIGNIIMRAHTRDGLQLFRLNSPFADATYEGTGSLKELIDDVQDLTLRTYLPSVQMETYGEKHNCHYEVDMNIHDSRTLLSYIMPKLYIADSTNVNLSINNGIIKAAVKSDRIAVGTTFARKLNLNVDNIEDRLNANITSSQFIAGGIEIAEPTFTAHAADDKASLSIKFDNFNGSDSYGEINLDGEVSRDEADSLIIKARPIDSFLCAGKDRWDFDPSEIILRGRNIRFENFSAHNGIQSIFIDGSVSATRPDVLTVALSNLDMSGLDQLMKNPMDLKGITTARAVINSPTKSQLSLLVDLDTEDLWIKGANVGDITITSTWEDGNDRIHFHLLNTLEGLDALNANCTLKPASQEIKARAIFNDFQLSAIAPFLESTFSDIGGYFNGMVDLDGKVNEVHFSSRDLRLDDAMIKVGITNVPYYLNGPIDINDNGLFLNELQVEDETGGSATLNGALRFNDFKDISLDAKMNIRNLEILSAPYNRGSGFYGNLRANGNVALSGPLSSLVIDADVATAGDGDVHVPLSGTLKGSTSNLLTFTKPEQELDPYERMLLEYQEEETSHASSDVTIKGDIRISEGTKVYLEIDKSTGHMIYVNGDGNIGLQIRPKKDIFNLNGDYIIRSGKYRFVLPGLLDKDFTINGDSYLRFGGDLMDSEINIDAVYPVKTSLATLIATADIGEARRLVNCGINISNNLKAPDIKFTVDVPDLSPSIKPLVEAVLNTDEKVQTQFVALLLMGTFLPNEQTGVVNGTNLLYSNVSEIMSSQINNILSKLEIPIDIGLGYKEGNSGTNIFDVAVSTQLFNNRVVVNGTVGNRRSKETPGQTNGDIVGDLDIELKLDKAGRFRLNAFSHSADAYTNFLDYSQRNGLGISYQKEFNTFGEFFKDMFTKKDKESFEKQAPSDTVLIKINNEQQAISDSLSVRR